MQQGSFDGIVELAKHRHTHSYEKLSKRGGSNGLILDGLNKNPVMKGIMGPHWSELNCGPQRHIYLEPQNAALFGRWVFAENVKY